MTRFLTALVAVFLWALPGGGGGAHAADPPAQQCSSVDTLISAMTDWTTFGEQVTYTNSQAQTWLRAYNAQPPEDHYAAEHIIFFRVTIDGMGFHGRPAPLGTVVAWLINGICVTNTLVVSPEFARVLDLAVRRGGA